VGEVVLMACMEWEKGGKKRGSGGDGAAPFYTGVAGEAMEGGWAARGRHMAARRTWGPSAVVGRRQLASRDPEAAVVGGQWLRGVAWARAFSDKGGRGGW
jgi:hypothetical protein